MIATNYSEVRNNLKAYCDKATKDYETIIITRKNNENVVLMRNGNEGIGKPEPLQHELSGYWSRRIDDKNRLVYKVSDNQITIVACANHYK